MSESSLWKIEKLMDYSKTFDSDLPPLYDFEQVRPIHREIEVVIIEHWARLHPVIQDFITSWWHQWANLKKQSDGMSAEIEQKTSMLSNYKNSSEAKIKDLEEQLRIKQPEFENNKSELQEKELKLQELEGLDKEKQLGIAHLRIDLEKELAELNLKLSEMQTKFESTQVQVVRSFEQKQMVFESEVASLREQIISQEQKIQDLKDRNQSLKAENDNLEILKDKIWEINEKLRGISFTEIKE